jgi:hypothetical protein
MPEGFKTYTVLVDSTGNVYQVPSCSIVLVSEQQEERLRDLLDNSDWAMNQILPKYNALDLAPIVREGMEEGGSEAPAEHGTHLVLVDPSGKIHRIESDQPCSIVLVDVFVERELRGALGSRRNPPPDYVDRILVNYDASDLAPIVRKGIEG